LDVDSPCIVQIIVQNIQVSSWVQYFNTMQCQYKYTSLYSEVPFYNVVQCFALMNYRAMFARRIEADKTHREGRNVLHSVNVTGVVRAGNIVKESALLPVVRSAVDVNETVEHTEL